MTFPWRIDIKRRRGSQALHRHSSHPKPRVNHGTSPRSVHLQLAQCQLHGDGAVVRRGGSSRSRNKVRCPTLNPQQNPAFGGVFWLTARPFPSQTPDLGPTETDQPTICPDTKPCPQQPLHDTRSGACTTDSTRPIDGTKPGDGDHHGFCQTLGPCPRVFLWLKG